MMSDNYDDCKHRFKVVLMGSHGVGKTSLLRRLCRDTFSLTVPETRGLSDQPKRLRVFDKDIVLHLWDTAGTEKYRPINALYIRRTPGAIIAFDVTRKETFNDLGYWLKELFTNSDDPQCILVGNKIDLTEQREVRKEDAEEFARKNKLIYVETSAKDNVCVSQAFERLGEMILEKNMKSTLSGDNSRRRLSSVAKPVKKGCCN